MLRIGLYLNAENIFISQDASYFSYSLLVGRPVTPSMDSLTCSSVRSQKKVQGLVGETLEMSKG